MDDRDPATVERLRSSGWQAALAGEPDSYHALATALREEATKAEAAGDTPRARMLELLRAICSLGFEPTSRGQPFQPYMRMQGQRTFLPDDLDPNELTALADFGSEIANGLLGGRLADIGWVYLRPRHQSHAQRAIDAYCATAIHIESWFHVGLPNWTRAVVLCQQIKNGPSAQLEAIERRLLGVVLEDGETAAPLRCSVAKLLRETGLGKREQQRVAERLEQDGREYLEGGDPLSARGPLIEAANWYGKAQLHEELARTASAIAETLIAEGELFEANATGGSLVASTFFRNALVEMQKIRGRYRKPLRVVERIRELRQRITECNKRGLEQMLPYESSTIDITRIVEEARTLVAGKPTEDALLAFSRLVPTAPADHWRQVAADAARESPLSTLFPSSRLSDDGRVIAATPGLHPNDPESPEWKRAIDQKAVEALARFMCMCVHGRIRPALEILHTEHRLREHDFVALAASSPMVPNDRAVMVGRGLCAGFHYDFAVAVHLLTPQLEHIVRSHLRAAGAQTRHMDGDGIENEVGLSSLMDLPEATQVFGNLAFEIRTVFCEQTGFNLRNKLAHGLLDDTGMHTDATVFAWWFCLKLVMLPIRSSDDGSRSTESVPGAGDS